MKAFIKVGIIGLLLGLTIWAVAYAAQYSFGDGNISALDDGRSNDITAARYLNGATAGTLDSIKLYLRNSSATPDTIRVAIYSAAYSFLARSLDSVIIPPDLSYYQPWLHFTPGTVTISSNTYYWIAVHGTSNGTSAADGGTGSNWGYVSALNASADSIMLFVADTLPFNSTLSLIGSAAVKYSTASVKPISALMYYTSGGVIPPAVPTPYLPLNGAVGQSGSPTFVWRPSASGTPPITYRLQVGAHGDFTTLFYNTSGISDTFVTVGSIGLVPSVQYDWRVKAFTATDSSAYSSIFVFTVATPNSVKVQKVKLGATYVK